MKYRTRVKMLALSNPECIRFIKWLTSDKGLKGTEL